MAFALCFTMLALGQYGGKTAKPYAEKDVQYGRTLQAKIDADRAWCSKEKKNDVVIPASKIVGDLYRFGTYGSGGAVIKTPAGNIMIDFAWTKDTADQVIASLDKIGINVADVKYFLSTEQHGDHNAGVGVILAKSHAKLLTMEGDEEPMARQAAPAKVDEVIKDGYQLKFGGKVLTAYHIKGHTLGSTTWYWQEKENGQTYNVADVCCWFVPNNVVTDPDYPTDLLRKNWQVLKSLPVDIPFPGIHPWHFNTYGKLARVAAGEKGNVYIDPEGYRGVIAAFERDFEDKVQQQLKDGPPPPRQKGPPKQ